MKDLADSVEPVRRVTSVRRVAALGLAVLAAGFLAAVFTTSPAHASPRVGAQTCTPPTNAYGSSTTIADCGSTTTSSVPANVTLTISYGSGHVMWKACAGAAAQGSTAQLYIDGNQESSAQVNGSGCTPENNLALCLAPATYNATAVDQPYGEASQSFTVSDSGCSNPTVLAGSGAATGSGSGGGHSTLAFTGSDIALMVVGALMLITVGLYTVRMARQRGRAV